MHNCLLLALVVWLIGLFGDVLTKEGFTKNDLEKNDNQRTKEPMTTTIVKTIGPGFEKTERTEYDLENNEGHYSEEIIYNDNSNDKISPFEEMMKALNDPFDNKEPIDEIDNNTSISFDELIPKPFPLSLDIPIPLINPIGQPGIILIKRNNLKGMNNPFNHQNTLSPFGIFINNILSDIIAKTEDNNSSIPLLLPNELNQQNIIHQQESKEEISPQSLIEFKAKEKLHNLTNAQNKSIQFNKPNNSTNNSNTETHNQSFNILNKQVVSFSLIIIIIVLIIKYLISNNMITKTNPPFSINSPLSEEDEIKTLKLQKIK